MGFTKEQLLARLKELQIDFSQYEHPVVLTVEAQEKYVGDKGGGLSKNLFLKDKKSRFYIVSALADTKVDLKVLSQRLGLGKGGIRMAPEEALCEILQVPLGCVTPFALINESSRHVSLLLDKGFKTPERCFFHPLSNDMSISLSSCDLDKFLKSIGRAPSYIDLEANPPIGKDHPPDLAALVPSDSVSLSDPLENTAPLQAPAANPISSDKKSTTVMVNAAKPLGSVQDSKENAASKPLANTAHRPSPASDVGPFVEEILKKLSALLLSEMTEDAVRQHGEQLGTHVVDSIRKRLGPDLQSHATMFKNTAYTQGFYAGAHHQPKQS
uniref:YbaK/aminoacyl-tRNA synthetase-associated domain-containing protein n=1 Tax=Rhizophora mucronata TaxID=61149 RepID=A0A2P2JUD3_RHIMU